MNLLKMLASLVLLPVVAVVVLGMTLADLFNQRTWKKQTWNRRTLS